MRSGAVHGRPPERSATGGPGVLRGREFHLRRLSAARAIGYAVRILAFRFSEVGSRGRCDVLDRYFYDNFVQYALSTRRERVYARFLKALIPKPDLALLLVASNTTIAGRRGNYAEEYIATAASRYAERADLFPKLSVVRTDEGQSSDDELERAVQRLVGVASGR